jgi:hypothetical protein
MMTQHRGYKKHDREGAGRAMSGTPSQDGADRSIPPPRWRPRCPVIGLARSSRQIVKKRQCRLSGLREVVL